MTKPIKILFTIPNFITAGSGGAMLNIIRRLDRERFEPAVAVLKMGGALDEEVRRMGLLLIEAPFVIPAKPYTSLLYRANQAAKLFKPYGFDIWHSFHYGDDYTEPLVAKLAGAKSWVFTKKNMGWGSRAWFFRSLLAGKIAAQNTDMLKDFFDTPLFKGKTRLIPRGVDLKKFRVPQKKKSTIMSRSGVPEDAIALGCVAHLVPVKGHLTLIEAVARLPKVHLFLAGKPMDQDYTRDLHALVERLDVVERVHFLGGMDDVPAFLAEVDVVVLPTWDKWRREGCPVALLEAMACGKACVATDVPGSRDIIEDGVSGFLVEPENAQAMSDAIERLKDDPELRVRMGKAARLRIEANYSIEREVAAHEKLYEEIMAGRKK